MFSFSVAQTLVVDTRAGARCSRIAEDKDVPTVLRYGSWRFFFYSNEGSEPPHIHVAGADADAGDVAKFWLTPVSVVRSKRLRPHELRHLERVVTEHRELFLRAWNEHFAAP